MARLREGVARIFDPVAAGPPCVRALNVNLLLVGRKPHQVQTACQPRGEDPSSDHSALPRRGVLRERQAQVSRKRRAPAVARTQSGTSNGDGRPGQIFRCVSTIATEIVTMPQLLNRWVPHCPREHVGGTRASLVFLASAGIGTDNPLGDSQQARRTWQCVA